MKLKKIVSLIIQLALFIGIYITIQFWQSKDMLNTKTEVPQSQVLLKSVQTNKTQLLDLADQKNKTLLYFFAPWCQVCHLSVPNLVDLNKQALKDYKVVAVALDYESTTSVKDFIAQHEVNFPVYYGDRGLQTIFRVSVYPSYYLIDRNGVVTDKVTGYTSEIGMKLRL